MSPDFFAALADQGAVGGVHNGQVIDMNALRARGTPIKGHGLLTVGDVYTKQVAALRTAIAAYSERWGTQPTPAEFKKLLEPLRELIVAEALPFVETKNHYQALAIAVLQVGDRCDAAHILADEILAIEDVETKFVSRNELYKQTLKLKAQVETLHKELARYKHGGLKKYVVSGGTVYSRNDGDRHKLSAAQVAKAYGVKRSECIFCDNERQVEEVLATYPYLDHLSPREDGDYSLS